MTHPFERIPSDKRRKIFWVLLGTTVLLLTVQGGLYAGLKNSIAPQGIVSLELASTPDRLNQILASWSEGQRTKTAFSLGLNFLCLLALTNTIGLACVMAAGKIRGGVSRLGLLLAWAQWVAGGVWAVQNSLLARAILFGTASLSTELSSWLAMKKFALVGAGLLYAAAVGIFAAIAPAGIKARPA
jgi:hypothetical protein